MAWTTPYTWTVGEIITAAKLQTYLSDNLTYLKASVDLQTIAVTNKSAVTLNAGDVVIWDAANVQAVKTTTLLADTRAAGVISVGGSINTTVLMHPFGTVATVNVQGNVAIGNALVTSTTAQRAAANGSGSQLGLIGYATTSYGGGGAGTVSALICPSFNKYGGQVTQVSVTTGQGAGSPVNFNVTSSGSNRLLVVVVQYAGSGSLSGACTYGGTSLTDATGVIGTAGSVVTSIRYLLAPAVGTASLSQAFTGGATCRMIAFMLTEVNQSAPVGTGAGTTGTSVSPAVTPTCAPGDYNIGAFIINNNNDTPSARGAAQSIVDGPTIGFNAAASIETDKIDPATGASAPFTWTVPNSAYWAAVGLAVKPL